MSKLNLSDGDVIADRICLTLPAKFTRKHSSKIWKLMRSVAEVFKINVDGIDELFTQTNLSTASGEFVDEYVEELAGIKRKIGETDEQLKRRFYRNVFVYNQTRNGIKEIVFDVVGYYPTALVDKQKGGFFDSKFFLNDIGGGTIYSNNGQPFIGYIILKSKPSNAQIDELCSLLKMHKSLGIKLYLQWRKYDVYNGASYETIVIAVTNQQFVKIRGGDPNLAVGDYFDAKGVYNDKHYPALFGTEDESGFDDHKYIMLSSRPTDGEITELTETLFENTIAGDHLVLVIPNN